MSITQSYMDLADAVKKQAELIDSLQDITDITELRVGHILTCSSCDTRYEQESGTPKYCSIQCAKKAMTNPGKKYCGLCNKPKLSNQSCIDCQSELFVEYPKKNPGVFTSNL